MHASLHMLIATALVLLFVLALTQDIMYANLLCYTESTLTGTITPCNLSDSELRRVYETSILDLVTDCWSSGDYHISLLLLSLSLVFPLSHIVNNLRLALKQNASIEVSNSHSTTLCCSVLFEYAHKLCMAYLFSCILFINALFQSSETAILIPPSTLYQQIVLEADIAINLLIAAIVLSSTWTLYIQYALNDQHLFGHHRFNAIDNLFSAK